MTSMARQIARRNPNYESNPKPQYTEDLPDGGYKTLHPTKGWQYVSGPRIKAREAMANTFGFIR